MMTETPGAAAIRRAPAANSTSPASSALLRPSQSLSAPPAADPPAAPPTAALTISPWIQLSLRHISAPDQAKLNLLARGKYTDF